MSFQEAVLVQVVLEGVPLPAERAELIDYASRQEDSDRVLSLLLELPDREYGTLDEVGEALAPVQPSTKRGRPQRPRAESGLPPGGDAYTDASAESGSVREHGPCGD